MKQVAKKPVTTTRQMLREAQLDHPVFRGETCEKCLAPSGLHCTTPMGVPLHLVHEERAVHVRRKAGA